MPRKIAFSLLASSFAVLMLASSASAASLSDIAKLPFHLNAKANLVYSNPGSKREYPINSASQLTTTLKTFGVKAGTSSAKKYLASSFPKTMGSKFFAFTAGKNTEIYYVVPTNLKAIDLGNSAKVYADLKQSFSAQAAQIIAANQRVNKTATLEKLFRDVTTHGIYSVAFEIDHDALLAVDESDYVAVAKKINTFSSLMSVAEKSSNDATSQRAYDLEDDWIKHQKSWFPALRSQYLSAMNSGRMLNSDFEYPNRCSNLDQLKCNNLEIDSYCKGGKSQGEQTADELSVYAAGFKELRISMIDWKFQDSGVELCAGFSTTTDFGDWVPDDQLMPTSYILP